MKSELEKLQRDLARLETLLSLVADARAVAILQQLTLEAKARLRELEWEEAE